MHAIITRQYLNLNSACPLTASIIVFFWAQFCLVYSVNFLLGVARLSLTEVDVILNRDVRVALIRFSMREIRWLFLDMKSCKFNSCILEYSVALDKFFFIVSAV